MRKLIVNCEDITGWDFSVEKQIEMLAEIGWDGVFTLWNEQDGNKPWADLIKRNSMIYQSVHAPFDRADKLWEEGTEGDMEVERLKKCLQDCCDAGVNLVIMHAIIGMEKDTPNSLGVDRFGKIIKEAEKLGVKIALENTEGEAYLKMLSDAFKDNKTVGFCIDTGHEMCYNHSTDVIEKYGKNGKLIATHLNDNMGMTGDKISWFDDSHMLPFDGIANWDNIAKRLKKFAPNIPLTFEIIAKNRPGRHTHDIYNLNDYNAFYSLALEKAKRFAEMVENK